jgi:hypothetical protein
MISRLAPLRTLVVLGAPVLAVLAVIAGAAVAYAGPCIPDGGLCRTNQSCCGGVCVNSNPPGKRPKGMCCTPSACAPGQCGMVPDGTCPDMLPCPDCPAGMVCSAAHVCVTTTTTTSSTTTSTTLPACNTGGTCVSGQCVPCMPIITAEGQPFCGVSCRGTDCTSSGQCSSGEACNTVFDCCSPCAFDCNPQTVVSCGG